MAVVLEDYGAVKVENRNHTVTFYIPLDGPRDILLADFATELNVYNNRMSFEGERFMAVSGVQKYMASADARWMAEVKGIRS
nr:MAG TPA: hypothetical protein [Caudoviricetes sp.]